MTCLTALQTTTSLSRLTETQAHTLFAMTTTASKCADGSDSDTSFLDDIKKAIENESFHMVFQPKCCFKNGRLIGSEALIRWRHPKHGLLNPADFLDLAHANNLMIDIDLVVIKKTIDFMLTAKINNMLLPVSINLSAQFFSDEARSLYLIALLRENRINPAMLEIEIPEGDNIFDSDICFRNIKLLASFGIKISIDDFGARYSALSYLMKFPVSTIKLDRAFIQEIAKSKVQIAIVIAVIDLAHALGMDVVAEGVETASELEVLRQLQCDYLQGYYYSKPMLPEQFLSFAETAVLPADSPICCATDVLFEPDQSQLMQDGLASALSQLAHHSRCVASINVAGTAK